MKEVIFYLGTILTANWLVSQFGLVTFLGLTFPAGAVLIGLTFSARDFVQRIYGKYKCWVWMGIATAITLLFNITIAIASISAFLISETIDWLIYTFSKKGFRTRIILSNIFGIPIDSFIFVVLAFGFNWSAIWGQTIIKILSSLVVLFFIKRSTTAYLEASHVHN